MKYRRTQNGVFPHFTASWKRLRTKAKLCWVPVSLDNEENEAAHEVESFVHLFVNLRI